MAMRVLYVNPLALGGNPAIDAIAYGLQHTLCAAEIELRVLFADFTAPDYHRQYEGAIEAGIANRVDAIVIYVITPSAFQESVAKARAAGIPVFTFVRPYYPVNASVIYPNFNQGVLMTEHLVSLLAAGSGVAVIGGPQSVDDTEEVAGVMFALNDSHCQLLNDPTQPQYCTLADVATGAREPMSRLLGEFPRIHGLIPYNDETMHGALTCLEEVGRAQEMKIVCRNGSPVAVEAVRQGKIIGTWDLDASGIGTTLGEVIVRHLTNKEQYEEFLVMSPVGRMITLANLHTWRPWSERVQWLPLTIGL
jgi:ABC-type sugar transport system substrate-binding protein